MFFEEIAVRKPPCDLILISVGVISQDPFLFTGTIRDNLDPRGLYSDHELVQVQYFLHSRTSIRINTDQALCKCGIMETFSENSDIGILMRDVAAEFQFKDTGVRESNEAEQRPVTSSTPTVVSVAAEMLLNCHVVDAASTLSQGQKQLLCVARILLGMSPSSPLLSVTHNLSGNPRFVFLDEASSSLDPTSELLMYKALQAHLPPQTTVLAVSHRYDREGIRSLCTQVLELDNGRVTKYEDIFFL